MRSLNLATVCEEAACPNIGECWTKKHATVMILGDTCTRACAFCNVKTGMPRAVDPLEPEHVATAAAELGLTHIVVTSVDRDDLPDGGAKQFVRVIEALRRNTPSTTIEILTPDFRNKPESAVEAIVAARPDVYNHNLETVPRLYPTIRPGARYYASLRLLESVKRQDPTIFTKSGLMVGLGEQRLEVHQVMDDMRSADVDFLTMGQYLQPTPRHARVEEFVTPQAFSAYGAIARAKGFLLVAASPLTRSSYHAGDDFAKMKAAREAKLADSASEAGSMPRHTETRHMPYTPRADVRSGRRREALSGVPALGGGGPGALGQRDADDRRPRRRLPGDQGDLHLAGREAAARTASRPTISRARSNISRTAGCSGRTGRAAPRSTSASTSPSRTGCSRAWPARCSTARCGG